VTGRGCERNNIGFKNKYNRELKSNSKQFKVEDV
jgi:hypothetical protein